MQKFHMYGTYMVLSKYKKDRKYFVIISFHKKKQIQSFGVGLSPIYYRQVMALNISVILRKKSMFMIRYTGIYTIIFHYKSCN